MEREVVRERRGEMKEMGEIDCRERESYTVD
jgi:hypothetical protein